MKFTGQSKNVIIDKLQGLFGKTYVRNEKGNQKSDSQMAKKPLKMSRKQKNTDQVFKTRV